MGKLFKTSRPNCNFFYAINLALVWKFTYELLPLQVKILTPPPSPLSLKIEKIHPVLAPSLSPLLRQRCNVISIGVFYAPLGPDAKRNVTVVNNL